MSDRGLEIRVRPRALRWGLVALAVGMLGLGACAHAVYWLPGIEDPYGWIEMFLLGGTFSVQRWGLCVLWLVCASLAAPRSLSWAVLLAGVSLSEFAELRDLAGPVVSQVAFAAAALSIPGALVFAFRRPGLWRESLAAALYAAGVCASAVPIDSWVRFAGEAAGLVAACVLTYALADALAARASTMRSSPA